ncbi:hypothetical protein IM40_10350 (plasmid) [Candidatus Paracaedimonas acanthamoebae]|nr:hypothetical protein IM40_10350 [Candidatus Paracaedimonas acanthamoebae]
MSLSYPLKASLNEEQREKLLAFSSSGKTRLANLAIKYNCPIDELLKLIEDIDLNGEDVKLRQDVNGLLVVMGNITGATLTTKGTSIKNTINSNSLTIALGLATVEADLGGNGDLHTRAQALQQRLQTLLNIINQARIEVYGNNAPDLIPAIQVVQNIIPGINLRDGAQLMVADRNQARQHLQQAQDVITQAKTEINNGAASLPEAMTQLRTVVNPAVGSNILLATQQIVADRDQAQNDLQQAQNDLQQAQDVITQAKTEINNGAASLPAAITQLRTVVNPAVGSNILLTTEQIIAERNQAQNDLQQAQDVITQAKTEINNGAASLPEAMTQLRTVVNPAVGSNILLTAEQIIAERNQAQNDLQTMQQGVQNLINIITNNIAGAFRTQGAFPHIPPTGLNNLNDIATYINNINS